VKIGRTTGLSEKDIKKINKMYETICKERERKNIVKKAEKTAKMITE